MSISAERPQGASGSQPPAEHPLLSLANEHLERATQAVMFGHFNVIAELRDPKRMLVVYRKRYGGDVVGDEYFVAQPTYITGPRDRQLRAGETIVFDFAGQPAIEVVEGMLYRKLLENDPAAQALVARHLANHASP